jgi:ankyrin repeat protein
MAKITKKMALDYHSQGKPSKIEIVPTKSHQSQTDLSLAYSPGVAYPCLEIKEDPTTAYRYTNKGNLMVLNYLFDHCAKANVNNGNGEPVIDNAVNMGNKEVVVRLLEQLKKEGVEPQNLATAVLIAAKTGKADMLEVLANAGAPLENRSPDGYLPIHWTVKSGNYDAMKFLISKGVDVNAKCAQGYSVLDWATNEGFTRLIKELKKHGAKNTAKYKIDSRGR